MPESAEVKITTEFLKKKLENKVISGWVFTSGQYMNEYPTGFDDFEKNLPLIVENVQCKGKFIYFTVFNEHGYFYILHSLRMTGRWQEHEDRHCRWFINLEDNDDTIWFRDSRCFATLEFTSDKSRLQNALDNLGPDVLTNDISLEIWKEMVNKHKNKNITSFLMNQNIISGIGNYLKAEILFYAKISPFRKTGSLSEIESNKLYEGVRIIPRISYNKGGLNKYVNALGEQGNYEPKIYGDPHVDRDKTSDGRMTYWDPEIQK